MTIKEDLEGFIIQLERHDNLIHVKKRSDIEFITHNKHKFNLHMENSACQVTFSNFCHQPTQKYY